MSSSIFVFAYYSFNDPVFQSAVLQYLKLPYKTKPKFILLTWEQEKYKLDQQTIDTLQLELAKNNIEWYYTSWHSGNFKFIKKIYDSLFGIFLSIRLITKNRCKKIYSEGFPGAIIGHFISLLTAKPHVVHTFEPHAEYMLESGVWNKDSWEYKALKFFENRVARKSSLIITATNAYAQVIQSMGVKESKIQVIPSLVNTELFQFDKYARLAIRKRLGIQNKKVITYLGKFGGMYMEDEFFKFCSYLEKLNLDFYYFIFTDHPLEILHSWIHEYSLNINSFFITKLDRKEVPKYLSASDFGFVGVKPFPSKRYCSPIKSGEYWACGLPLVIPNGISDDFEYCQKYNLGYVFSKIDDETIADFVSKSYNNYDIVDFAIKNRGLLYHTDTFSKIFK